MSWYMSNKFDYVKKKKKQGSLHLIYSGSLLANYLETSTDVTI